MRVLGVDGGIASVGWAVIDIEPEERTGQIVAAGTWMFESPEEPTQSGPKLKNADRRMYRGQRRVVHRRAQRMRAIRTLFAERKLTASADKDALRGEGLDPWKLRAEGLDRLLTPYEWALALGHIAIHRGFRSNKKNKQPSNKANDDSRMLVAIEETKERLAKWRTVGEMFAHDPAFADRRRNRGGAFTRSILRDDQEAEVRRLFAAQRNFGNPAADDDFHRAFIDKAFSQRPLRSSEDLVGLCPFETGERRTARFAPGFEKFRLYSRLTALRLQTGRTEQALTPEQIGSFPKDYGLTAKLTYKALRKHLDLDANTRFAGLGRDAKEENNDFVARHGLALAGTAKFRKVLEPVIGALETKRLLAETTALDRAAEIITFNEDANLIRTGLATTSLNDEAQAAIVAAVESGEFDEFKGAGHISAKAAAAIVPGLMRGLVYSEACSSAGYDHSASAVTSVNDVTSPVARKALSEMLKQIRILERVHGNRIDEEGKKRFDRIHVEMARDVGKSIEERGKMERGIEKRNKEKDDLRQELAELLTVTPDVLRGEDLLRYELWKEQNGRSLYSDRYIPPPAIRASDNSVQVDHILPWSRFGDDSFRNKTLCFTGENADKRGRTPFEWFSEDKPPADWDEFVARVETSKALRGFKKRNYLLRNAHEVEERFRNRNLNDTRYALRALLAHLDEQYGSQAGVERRVFARPGELTSKLRQAWGVEALKKGPDGERLADDRHHALDAMVLAVCNESLLQRATRASQEAERHGQEFHLRGLPEPWDGFREEVKRMFGGIFVARQTVHRERGKAHDATIKQMREIGGETAVFERKAVEKLTEKDLDLIPIPEPYGGIVDPKKLRDQMVESLRGWIKAGKPKDQPPLSPKGDIIRKVRVRSNAKPAVLVRGGTADRGDMVRVDVFTRLNKKGENQFFLVPVYVHEVATLDAPPVRAVQANTDEAAWPIMGTDFSFAFILHPMSLVEIITRDGEVKTGYFRGLDRTTGAIAISSPENSTILTRGIGTRTLKAFKKLRADRLGHPPSEAKHEVRLWRGKAYISQDLPESALPTAS
jgi:CRISPR-associated endonuclease Csn1